MRALEVRGYRSIKRLSIELPTVALVVGANATGKTNLIVRCICCGRRQRVGGRAPARVGERRGAVRGRGRADIVRATRTPVLHLDKKDGATRLVDDLSERR
jgi:recombinational DNA repair ATPase RecF